MTRVEGYVAGAGAHEAALSQRLAIRPDSEAVPIKNEPAWFASSLLREACWLLLFVTLPLSSCLSTKPIAKPLLIRMSESSLYRSAGADKVADTRARMAYDAKRSSTRRWRTTSRWTRRRRARSWSMPRWQRPRSRSTSTRSCHRAPSRQGRRSSSRTCRSRWPWR